MAGMLSPIDIASIIKNNMLQPISDAQMVGSYPAQETIPPPPNPMAPMAGGPPMPVPIQNDMAPLDLPAMPQAMGVNPMFQSQDVAPIPQEIPQAAPQAPNWSGALDVLGQFAAQIGDAQARMNLPADLYLKMKQQQNEVEMANQDRLLKNMQMEADAKYQEQMMALRREELALRRKEMLRGPDAPSAVREYQYFSSLSPEEQRQFINVKRAQQVIDYGGGFSVLSPTDGLVPLVDKTLAPGELPSTREAQAEAEATGRFNAEIENKLQKKEIDANDAIPLINKAMELLPQSTSGGAETMLKSGAQFFGQSTKSSQADTQLNILSAKLVGAVPRFEGPQGVLDVQLYMKAAGDLANTEMPYADRMAAGQLMIELNNKYATGQKNTFNTVQEAEAANLPKGTEVIIGGRRAVIE